MKILLVCNAGMSSSILVDKMKKAAAERELDIEIKASPMLGLEQEKGLWDVCMVGPQISYAVERIKGELGIPVLAVEPRTYALADGNAAIDAATKLWEASK